MAVLTEESINIKELSNFEIFHMLKSANEKIGPVTRSTRNSYEKKLRQLLKDGLIKTAPDRFTYSCHQSTQCPAKENAEPPRGAGFYLVWVAAYILTVTALALQFI